MSLFRKKLGNQGEDLACDYLKQHGYTIILRNYRKKCGEIDIIARENDNLVFIEVKTRSSLEWDSPIAAVTVHKQKQIIKTAQHYLAENNYFDEAIRFDVLGITLVNTNVPDFELITAAFEL